MLLLKSNTFLSRSFLLLLICFSTLDALYYPVYNKQTPQLEYSIENENYVVTLNGQRNINYTLYDGLKFYIPNFTKEFSLQILRFNSVGYIDGYISATKYKKNVIASNPNDLKYYFTDYKTDSNQLKYLLNSKTMLYPKVTSIAIEAYNIPKYTKLNKTFYITIYKHPKNKLKYLVCSFKMILDKKSVDNFVKKNLPLQKFKIQKLNYIFTYMNSLNKKVISKKKKARKKKKIVKKEVIKRVVFKLDLARLLFMKEYPYEVVKLEQQSNTFEIDNIKNSLNLLQSDVNYLKNFINTKLDTYFLAQPYKLLKGIKLSFDSLDDSIANISSEINTNLEEKQKTTCIFQSLSKVDKNCFNNKIYFNNYIYHKIQLEDIPLKEEILGFGDYKTFNNIAKYYFEIGEYEKSKTYLFKAYTLADKKDIINHNLGVLYAKLNSKQSNEDSIKYFEKSHFKEDYFNLGVNYYIGLGAKENDKKAYQYFLKSSKMNLQKATNNVKIMQKYKIGVK